MGIRITLLCENSVGDIRGLGEHGFSALIETSRGHYLFDTGGGHTILPNALAFEKDLKDLKKVCLSHGHHDHTGGLPLVLQRTGAIDVHAHPDVFLERIAVLKSGEEEIRRFVGLPYRRVYLEFLGARFVLERGFHDLEQDIFLTGEVPRSTSFEGSDSRLLALKNGEYRTDEFKDDQSMVLDTPKGLVVIFGCAHAGMVNTLRYAMDRVGNEKIHAIIGGTHLAFLAEEQLEASIKTLKELSVQRIGVSHCTGLRAASRLAHEFGDRFFFASVGTVLEV
jgi:7,8-dihydropterin-6-yl-methyl-4-(beta-D-ribofuranosyl)aminobenzene 5'-phosphate synthase